MVKKKLVSLALCAVMCVGMVVPAEAAELPEETGIVATTEATVDATENATASDAVSEEAAVTEETLQEESEQVNVTQHFFDWKGTVITNYTGVGGDIVIPSGCTGISKWAFEDSTVTSITIPDSVDFISEYAFNNCKQLKVVRLGNGITYINSSAFSKCSALTDVYMPYNQTLELGFAYYTKSTNCTYHVYDGTEAHKEAIQNGYNYVVSDKFTPNPVNNLKAASVGRKQIKLTWDASAKADGYIIYAIKNKKYGYCGMTSNTAFTDIKAVDDDYTFYFVYPYKKFGKKNNVGKCPNYVYAKAVCSQVTNLKASSVKGGVKLTWTRPSGANGYIVYGMTTTGTYHYIGMTKSNVISYTDKKASKSEYNFYWVFPYHKDAKGNRIIGKGCGYVYAKAK